MSQNSEPECPKCALGGNVKLVTLDTGEVFKPMPDGWNGKVRFYQCECGWICPERRETVEHPTPR
jgi:hypothetical protein